MFARNRVVSLAMPRQSVRRRPPGRWGRWGVGVGVVVVVEWEQSRRNERASEREKEGARVMVLPRTRTRTLASIECVGGRGQAGRQAGGQRRLDADGLASGRQIGGTDGRTDGPFPPSLLSSVLSAAAVAPSSCLAVGSEATTSTARRRRRRKTPDGRGRGGTD